MKPYIVRPTYESSANVYARGDRRLIGYLIGRYDGWDGHCTVRGCWSLQRPRRRQVAAELWRHYLDEHKEQSHDQR